MGWDVTVNRQNLSLSDSGDLRDIILRCCVSAMHCIFTLNHTQPRLTLALVFRSLDPAASHCDTQLPLNL
jgi:hypothetical protein